MKSFENLKPKDMLSQWNIIKQPYYNSNGNEIKQFEIAWSKRLPLLIKGPTGCGKTRFIEHMAWRLKKPLITIACNEDTTAGDLLGRWILDSNGTRWQDGPLTLAARYGAICYLDEVVEARSDTLVAIHPLSDTRRILPLDRNAELIHAHNDFMLVVSYNPGGSRQIKTSTKQRFCGIEFQYPNMEHEVAILIHETKIEEYYAKKIVSIGWKTRHSGGEDLDQGASTRMLIRTAELFSQGMDFREACQMGIVFPLTDMINIHESLTAAIDAII